MSSADAESTWGKGGLVIVIGFAIAGAAAGELLTGLQLGVLSGIASAGMGGPDLAGLIASAWGVAPGLGEVATFVGEYAPAMAAEHPLAALVVLGGGGGGLIKRFSSA